MFLPMGAGRRQGRRGWKQKGDYDVPNEGAPLLVLIRFRRRGDKFPFPHVRAHAERFRRHHVRYGRCCTVPVTHAISPHALTCTSLRSLNALTTMEAMEGVGQ